MAEQFAECNLKAFFVSNVAEHVLHMKLFKEAETEDDDDNDAVAIRSFPRGLCQRRCDAKFAGQLNT
ncbi:unnamed protein product [Cercopithifilaria johnstoni]|uniref:Uncharacterized protein n=1 Tax=Cercopithifilaria johnstoni TaxID=2874296 RepID=A0A8J2Q477_9BILA|nr:unnamed protein product [Cercopithifilaria johnstoni]